MRMTDAVRAVLALGHRDTCGRALGDYPCSCGHDALAMTLEAEAELDLSRRAAAKSWLSLPENAQLPYDPGTRAYYFNASDALTEWATMETK